jgi:hypothetical protein
MSATDDVRDDTSPTASSVPVSEPASAADTIRGAFLKHAIDAERQASGGGLGDGDAAAGTITLRGAFVSRLTTSGPGALRGGGTGEGETLRSVYAARFAALIEPAPAAAPRRGTAKPARRAAKPAKTAKAKKAPAKAAKPAKAKAKPVTAKPARAKPAKAKPAKAKPAKAKPAKAKKVAAKAKSKPKAAKRAKAAAATKAAPKKDKKNKKAKKGKRR